MANEPAESAAAAKRRRVAGYFVAALLTAALIGGLIVLVIAGGGDDPAADEDFGPHYEGLEDRRLEAGVPTMGEGGGEHFHPELQIYVRGGEIPLPANVGIDPTRPPELMAGLHTHDSSGTIHNEAGTGATLGDFFAIWGVPFSAERLGPYEEAGSEEVRMWVNGRPSRSYEDLKLAEGQEIVVAYGGLPQGVID